MTLSSHPPHATNRIVPPASGIVHVARCALTLAALLGLAVPASAQLNRTLHDDGWILAAAHAPGLQGSIWRTDLFIRFEHDVATATLTFCETNVDNTGATTFEVETAGGFGVYIEDVVDHFLGIGGGSWLGAIHYTSSTRVQVYARVYSISPDGSRSFGQIVEGIPTADMSMAYSSPGYPGTREDQWIFPVKHTSDGRFRVNVGAVNPTGIEGRFLFQIFDETNNRPPNGEGVTVTIPPYSMVQLGDPFDEINGGDWSTYILRVEAVTEDTGVLAYASAVDNATNDAYFVRGVKMFAPGD